MPEIPRIEQATEQPRNLQETLEKYGIRNLEIIQETRPKGEGLQTYTYISAEVEIERINYEISFYLGPNNNVTHISIQKAAGGTISKEEYFHILLAFRYIIERAFIEFMFLTVIQVTLNPNSSLTLEAREPTGIQETDRKYIESTVTPLLIALNFDAANYPQDMRIEDVFRNMIRSGYKTVNLVLQFIFRNIADILIPDDQTSSLTLEIPKELILSLMRKLAHGPNGIIQVAGTALEQSHMLCISKASDENGQQHPIQGRRSLTLTLEYPTHSTQISKFELTSQRLIDDLIQVLLTHIIDNIRDYNLDTKIQKLEELKTKVEAILRTKDMTHLDLVSLYSLYMTHLEGAISIIYEVLSSYTTRQEQRDPLTIHFLIVFAQRLLYCKHTIQQILGESRETPTRPPTAACPANSIILEGAHLYLLVLQQVVGTNQFRAIIPVIGNFKCVGISYDPNSGLILKYQKQEYHQEL
jgi:hypothetical protein